MKKEFEINGHIEVPVSVSEEDFSKKFLQFVEMNNWLFTGTTYEIIDGEYVKPNAGEEQLRE